VWSGTCQVFDYEMKENYVMKTPWHSRHLQSRSTVILIIIFGLLAFWKLRLTCNEDIVSAQQGTRNTLYGNVKFMRPNHVITEYDNDVARRLETLVERRSTAADPDLIRLIMDMLHPPSPNMIKMSRLLFNTPQSREVDKILQQKV